MTPILYNAEETQFLTCGIGKLTDCRSCVVTEELNGRFELSLSYPVSSARYNDIAVGNIILAPTNPTDAQNFEKWQPFDIYSVRQSIGGLVSVNARHVRYRLNQIVSGDWSAYNAKMAMEHLAETIIGDNPFTFWTDVPDPGVFGDYTILEYNTPGQAGSRLTASKNSILSMYGGEFEWDRFAVKLHASRGSDRGVAIAYGKNLTSLEQDINNADALTDICPYAYKNGVLVTLPEGNIPVVNGETAPYPRVKAVDLSDYFDSEPTVDGLRNAAAHYISKNALNKPKIAIDLSFVDLSRAPEYSNAADLETILLGDTVTVRVNRLGISAKAKVTGVSYDVIKDRYTDIQIGDNPQSLDRTIAGIITGG